MSAMPEPGFKIETTTVDGRGYALLVCKPCGWYGENVSARVGGRIGQLFRARDLIALNLVAAAHQCPEEVAEYGRTAGCDPAAVNEPGTPS
jgi:hypothetical protein